MASNIYLLLGLEEGASLAEIKKAYARLVSALENDLKSDPAARSRLSAARERLSQAYEALKEPEIRKVYDSWSRDPASAPHEASEPQAPAADYCRPKLGQLLVASGLITMEELDAALEIQRNTGNMHVPLGELLVAAGYLLPEQLDYYLRV
ncbi:MAG TPA: DnaJ domain-containing protein, partial [Candidatus Obscuribacterales bacterium]